MVDHSTITEKRAKRDISLLILDGHEALSTPVDKTAEYKESIGRKRVKYERYISIFDSDDDKY